MRPSAQPAQIGEIFVDQGYVCLEDALVENADEDYVDDFIKDASRHVETMLSQLIARHRHITCSLHSEIRSLRSKLGNAGGKLQHDWDLQPSSLRIPSKGEREDASAVVSETSGDADNNSLARSRDKHPSFSQDAEGDVIRPSTPGSGAAEHRRKSKASRPSVRSASASEAALDTQGYGEGLAWGDMLAQPGPSSTNMEGSSRKGNEDLQGQPALRRFVFSNKFEVITGSVIVANTCVMALQQQYDGLLMGHKLDLDDGQYSDSAREIWPGVEIALSIFDIAFNVCFLVEWVLRVYANKIQSIWRPWIWLDTILVSAGLVDLYLGDDSGGFDPTMLRLVRLVRLVRILKVFTSVSSFDSLFLLLKALRASISALFWSLVLLILMQVTTGLFLGQTIKGFIDDVENDMAVRRKAFEYFGTFYRSMISMSEITFANWVPSCRFLVEEVSEYFFLFYAVYRMITCFAALKVIAAVFIAETNRVLASDSELTLMKVKREKVMMRKKMEQVLAFIDGDNDGTLTWDEVQLFLSDEELCKWLATIGLSRMDFEKLFWLSEVDGAVDVDSYINQVSQLKSNAQTVDLLNLFKIVRKMDARLQRLTNEEEDEEEKVLFMLADSKDASRTAKANQADKMKSSKEKG